MGGLRVRAVALVSDIMFHVGIALVIGLVSFGFAMIGSLLLAFVHPGEADRFRAWLMPRLRRGSDEAVETGNAPGTDGEAHGSPRPPQAEGREPVSVDVGLMTREANR